MRHLGLNARQKRAFKITTDSRHTLGYAHNILAQNFIVDHPNQVWIGDITYLKVAHHGFILPPSLTYMLDAWSVGRSKEVYSQFNSINH